MDYLSKERYDEIAGELKNLIEVEYPRIREELSEARAQGDLSEIFEYRAARRAQAKTISRIIIIESRLETPCSTRVVPKVVPSFSGLSISFFIITEFIPKVAIEKKKVKNAPA